MKSQGRPSTIHLAAQAGLLAYLKAKPWVYQDEMCLYLFDDWDILPTQSTTSRTLARMKISRQALKEEVIKWSQLVRNDYMLRISEYSVNQLAFLDKSAANDIENVGGLHNNTSIHHFLVRLLVQIFMNILIN